MPVTLPGTRTWGRTILVICLALLPIGWAGAAASALAGVGTPAADSPAVLADVRSALLQSPVYVEPGYGLLTAAQADQLGSLIKESGTPIYVVAVRNATADSAGGLTALLRQVVAEVGVAGTYVVADERAFRTTSSSMMVADLADQANTSGSGAFNVLRGYVSLVEQRANAPTASQPTEPGDPPQQRLPLMLMVAVAAAVGLWLVRRSRRPAPRSNAGVARLRDLLSDDITVIGEQLARVDAQDPRLGDLGRAQLGAALDAYDRARRVNDRMRVPAQAEEVTAALDDARHQLACVRAISAGEALPQRRPPCLFDPRHGTSVRDVMWTPPPLGFTAQHPREVPACAQCARTVDLGGAPAVRTVGGPHGPVPYWEGGAAYGPYTRGYFDAYGTNMLGALLVGTMFAQSWQSPQSAQLAADVQDLPAGPSDDAAGGLDLGGGGFGGGAWGTQDLAGGDFGGGDFGTGDFGGGF